MMDALLDAARRWAEANADHEGIARMPVGGLTVIRETAPTELLYAINKPLVALVLQGTKHVSLGAAVFDFGAGESLVIGADVPTMSQITRATRALPYFSIVIDLDQAVIEALVAEMGPEPQAEAAPVSVDPTEAEVADAALRLMRLIDRPRSQLVLQAQLVRELHFWLLSGRHGAAIRNLGIADSRAQRIARAVAVVRADYARPLRVERLADAAGLAVSTFHAHFRAVTSLTPLQFQKQLRLIEARRMMFSEGAPVSHAAYTVGYESVPQFTREYGRMFGQSPVRDRKAAATKMRSAA